MIKTLVIIAAAASALLSAASSGAAVSTGAICNEFNTSVRAEAMGGTGVALVWGQHPDRWANPALLSFAEGIRFSNYESQLAAGLANDIRIENRELTFGARGLGFLLATGPLDGLHLDMGTHPVDGSEEAGDDFSSWMATESWGFGLNFGQLANAIAGRSIVPLSRYFDLSAGYVHKSFTDKLAPDGDLSDDTGGSGKATSHDLGVLMRVTPIDSSDKGGFLGHDSLGLRLGLAGGYSLLDYGNGSVTHVDISLADPLPRRYVFGYSLHAALPLSSACKSKLQREGLGLLADALDPWLSFTWSAQTIDPGVVWIEETSSYDYEHDTSGEYDTHGSGWELGLGNILFVRCGETRSWGDIDGRTSGWGLNLPIGRWGGFRYEEATFPQAKGLSYVQRESWSFWVGTQFMDLF